MRDGLHAVQHDQDHVARPRRGDDLPPAALAVFGALDDPGQVENLDLGAAIPGRDGGERAATRRRRGGGGAHLIEPGTAVSVVNSYAAASEYVPVRVVSSVDLPTDGKPTRPMRVSPLFFTSKPRPPPPPPVLCGPAMISRFSLAIFALMSPRWPGQGGEGGREAAEATHDDRSERGVRRRDSNAGPIAERRTIGRLVLLRPRVLGLQLLYLRLGAVHGPRSSYSSAVYVLINIVWGMC